MKQLEITYEEIEKYVELRLRSVGFDMEKEIRCHAKLEDQNGNLTRIYTQEDDAIRLQAEKEQPELTRPDYLKDMK